MSTSQDSSHGKRAAHFSEESSDSTAPATSQDTSSPRTPTPRGGSSAASSRPGARRAQGSVAGTQRTARMSERTARATKRAAAARERRQDGSRKGGSRTSRTSPAIVLVALVALVAAVAVGTLVVPRLFQRDAGSQPQDYPSGEQVVVTIPDGAGGSEIAQLLIEHHVITDENVFYQEVQKQNADASLKSGTYQFITGASISEVVKLLVSGPNATEYRLKLAEGLTLARTAEAVEEQLGIPADDFTKQAKASNYASDYDFLGNVGDDSLEGYLFAKTYDFGGTDMSADTVIRTMLDQYQTEVGALDMESARTELRSRYNIEISDYGILRVASIIEKEAVTEEDRPLVSSVIYNRLAIGMAIQSDATMAYVTGGEVTADDLQTESPYNTYLNSGLTPTPICSPSIESIEAAMAPDDTNYLYFFINENVHQFSETYEEHQEAINESLSAGE